MLLVLNCGSQSIKWKIFDKKLKVAKEGSCAVLGQNFFQKSLEEELAKVKGMPINKIGHRVVHGGGIFSKPVKITSENLIELEKISHLAPLHNPLNVLGIKACQQTFENIPQYAVFDTEFFSNLPEKSYTYALPQNIKKEFGFRRYGFHGISHEYVARKVSKGKFNKLNIITCHLGGGSSITTIRNGKAIDTSMGFTPLEGLVMMTRPGNIDAGIILELVKKLSLEKTSEILNKESGIKGICGQEDMLGVLQRVKNGDKDAKLALSVFVYSIQKYIGAYFAVLGGCDILVFTGAIGFGSTKIRNMICRDLTILKKTKILAIRTDEELAIAEKVNKFIK